jgi:hypothetical protein
MLGTCHTWPRPAVTREGRFIRNAHLGGRAGMVVASSPPETAALAHVYLARPAAHQERVRLHVCIPAQKKWKSSDKRAALACTHLLAACSPPERAVSLVHSGPCRADLAWQPAVSTEGRHTYVYSALWPANTRCGAIHVQTLRGSLEAQPRAGSRARMILSPGPLPRRPIYVYSGPELWWQGSQQSIEASPAALFRPGICGVAVSSPPRKMPQCAYLLQIYEW